MRKDIKELRSLAFDDTITRTYAATKIVPKLAAEADQLREIHADCKARGSGQTWVDGGMVDLENEIDAAVMFADYRIAETAA